ncbi:hypothetical protein HAX54_024399, partial [Datura stramonium]|nr:hypothetical protein [Datura stramonium]
MALIWSLRTSYSSCEYMGISIQPSRPLYDLFIHHIAPASMWVSQYDPHNLNL